jgi:hypothetical protein
MRESATAGPVKLNGMVMAARQTESSTSHLPAEPVLVVKVMDFSYLSRNFWRAGDGGAGRNNKIRRRHFRQNSIRYPVIPE